MKACLSPAALLSLVLAALTSVAGNACKKNTPLSPDALADATIADAPEPDAPEPDAPVAPVFRNPVAMPDEELARAALQLIGANVADAQVSCNRCHSVARQNLRYWRTMSDFAFSNCITDVRLPSQQAALATVNCLRGEPNVPNSLFNIHHLGVLATAAHLPWFEFAFWRAYDDGTDSWKAKYQEFKTAVSMPRGGAELFTQAQFDIVAEYFARGLPALDTTLPPERQGPTTCTAGVSADVTRHVTNLATTGWRRYHLDNATAMFGCQNAVAPKDCLATLPLASATTWGATWDRPGLGHMRILKELSYQTSYWTRSSADGRFVGHGGGPQASGTVVDLQTDRLIAISAPYDPAFFPDNASFMFQNVDGGREPKVCQQSLLASSDAITFAEPSCTGTTAGLYQHVGRALDGGDLFTVSGCWIGDPARGVQTADPLVTRDQTCKLAFEPLIDNGNGYTVKPAVEIATPFEGDIVIAPSAQLIVSRVAGPEGKQLGYVLRKVSMTANATSYDITATEIARYCEPGAKPAISYDDRWLIYHHYIGDDDAKDLGFTNATDPGFADYRSNGAANVYLIDLKTGRKTRITHMAPGQYALFPHFRADGWIYMVVKDRVRNVESLIASPAALYAEAQP